MLVCIKLIKVKCRLKNFIGVMMKQKTHLALYEGGCTRLRGPMWDVEKSKKQQWWEATGTARVKVAIQG